MGSNEETNAAGTDTRPPMLVESDYDSWKIRIHRYIRGKPNGKLIWKSIQNGPTPHPMITDPPPTDSTVVPAPRKKLDSEFNEEENKLEMADTQAEIILSQGLPRHIFNNLNQTSTAKEIWDNVELLMQGSGRTLQQRKEDLFDEYERFRAIGNESIHDYFVRFHKLVNDMKITQLNIPTHQMNTKFVNNLPAYWGKYVTNVKQNMDISTTPYVQIYTHLKAYEPHAKKTLKKQEQSTSIVDPLAYVAHTTSAPALSSPSTPSPQPTAQSPNDALMATMTQIANLLSGFQKQFPPTNNQLRTSSNSRTHATVHDGHIVTEPVQRKAPGNNGNTGTRGKKVICYNCRGEGHVARQCKEPKRKMDSQYFKDKALLMEAKEKGDVLDAEAEAFLADVECTAPYDQPQALTTTNMFQANHEDAYDSDVDEGPNAAVAFMANLSSTSATNNPVNEVHSNDNQIFDNVDYQIQEMHQEEHLDSDAETEIDDNTIPYHQYLLDTEAQNVPTEVSADTSDKVSMIAILTDLQTQLDGHAKVNQEKCLEIETLKNELLQCKQEICRLDTHKVKLDLENKVRQEQALVIQRNMCNAELVQENNLLKSTLSGKEKSIAFLQSEKEKILSEKKELADSYIDEIKPKSATADLHKDLLGTRNPGLGYMAKRAQSVLYDADTLLHPTHHPVSIWDSEDVLVHQVDPLNERYENQQAQKLQNSVERYITSLRIQQNGLKVEKRESQRRVDLQPIRNPKYLAYRMYTKSSKYIPPPKRANWVKPTPLPKKKQVTFQEPPRTSNRPTQKLPVQHNKKPNVPVNLSTRTKPATESRKPMPKCHTRNHRILPNKSVNARRAADHNRKLNVVYHNQFVIRSLKSVNTKTPHAKHSVNHTKKVWKATRNHNVNTTKTAWRPTGKIVGSVKPQWKPTGRHFALYDKHVLLD
ncbi:retrovirus-related pol polyprotein from transposon TNT 1-94 [Tanacetum coccineum]